MIPFKFNHPKFIKLEDSLLNKDLYSILPTDKDINLAVVYGWVEDKKLVIGNNLLLIEGPISAELAKQIYINDVVCGVEDVITRDLDFLRVFISSDSESVWDDFSVEDYELDFPSIENLKLPMDLGYYLDIRDSR